MDACRVPYAGVAKETRVFRVDSLVFWDFVATLYVFLRDLTHKPLRLTNPYLDLTVQKHLEKKTPHQEDIMKTIALSLLILFMAVVAHAQNWYEPVPCYACDVDTSYNRQNNQGYTPNYGLGPNNGSSFGGGAPQGEWGSGYSSSSPQAQSEWYQPQPQQQPQSNFSYGVPGTGKPLAPCGPYYAPRAAENCY